MDEQTFEQEPVPGIEQPPEVTPEPQAAPGTEQVSKPEPAWKKQYATEDAMYADLRKFQAERDRLDAEVRRVRTAPQPQPQPAQRTPDQVLNEFIADPDGYIEKRVTERVMPYVAKAEIERYEATLPGFKEMKPEIREIIEANPAILNVPFGIEMVYNHLKMQKDTEGRAQASQAVDAARQQAEQTKRNEAFVEGATQPKRDAGPIIKPGMSIEESTKALDAMGIGYLPEDRYSER